MGVVRLAYSAVLGQVVDPDHLVIAGQELLYYIAPDEPGRAAHEYRRHDC